MVLAQKPENHKSLRFRFSDGFENDLRREQGVDEIDDNAYFVQCVKAYKTLDICRHEYCERIAAFEVQLLYEVCCESLYVADYLRTGVACVHVLHLVVVAELFGCSLIEFEAVIVLRFDHVAIRFLVIHFSLSFFFLL